MNAYLNYIIEVNIGLLLFLAFYHLLLRRETTFRMLRMFMLTGIFTSLLFPLLDLQNSQATSPLSMGQVIPAYWLPEMSAGQAADNVEVASFQLWTYTTLVYAIGFIFFSAAVLFQLNQLRRIIRRSKTYTRHKLRIAESNEDKPTFSFFNFIFIGKAHELSKAEKEQIILHEAVHVRQWHSFDILLINGLKIFFWFNPFINAYKKIFIQLHEFEADARAVENSDVNKYCSLLARVALESADFKLANHFNSSLTVKRITMIRSSKNNISYWKVAVCALLLPATFLLVSCQDQLGNTDGVSGEIFSQVDEPANPQGGLESFYQVIKRNITYPAKSRADHKYGKVLVRFVVNENGSLSDMEVLESPDELLGKEAIRMLTLSPEWTPAKKEGAPVKQQMVLPIEFKLDIPGKGIQPKENTSSIRDEKTSLQQIVVVGYAK
jgi:TonB family protein